MLSYKDTFTTMSITRGILESRIWYMINLLDEYDTNHGDDYTNLVCGLQPESYKGDWVIDLYQTASGIQCDFSRIEPYDDYTENRKVTFTWEEWQYDDEAVIGMWKERGKSMYEQQEATALRELRRQAELSGYSLTKIEGESICT